METVEKIGRFAIATNRGVLYLRWWNSHAKKTESERIRAKDIEQARTLAKARIKILSDRTEAIRPGNGDDPTFGEIWLGFEQDKRKKLTSQRFRLLENRRDLYFQPHLWQVPMSKMGPALRKLVEGMEAGKIRPESPKSKLKMLSADGKPCLHPNTIADIVGSSVEACALAKSDGLTIHNPPKIPFISGVTAPEDRDQKGRYLSFEEIGKLIEACRRPHMLDLLLLDLGCGGRIGAVVDLKGEFVFPELGVIDLLGAGVESSKRKPIVPITGPMGRILARLLDQHGDDYLIRAGAQPLAAGARNWTQMIQRLVERAGIDKDLKPGSTSANWYSIRRTFADWLDERVSDAAISPVMGTSTSPGGPGPSSSTPAAP